MPVFVGFENNDSLDFLMSFPPIGSTLELKRISYVSVTVSHLGLKPLQQQMHLIFWGNNVLSEMCLRATFPIIASPSSFSTLIIKHSIYMISEKNKDGVYLKWLVFFTFVATCTISLQRL